MVTIIVNGVRREIQVARRYAAALRPAKRPRAVRAAVRLRTGAVRGLFGPARRQGNPLVHHASFGRLRQGSHDARRAARAMGASRRACRKADAEKTLHPVQAGLDRGADAFVRLLPERHDDQGDRAAGTASRRRPSRKSKRRSRPPVRRRICAAAEATPPSSKPCSAPARSWRRGGKPMAISNEKSDQRFWRHADAP